MIFPIPTASAPAVLLIVVVPAMNKFIYMLTDDGIRALRIMAQAPGHYLVIDQDCATAFAFRIPKRRAGFITDALHIGDPHEFAAPFIVKTA